MGGWALSRALEARLCRLVLLLGCASPPHRPHRRAAKKALPPGYPPCALGVATPPRARPSRNALGRLPRRRLCHLDERGYCHFVLPLPHRLLRLLSAGAATTEAYLSPATSDLALHDDGHMETPLSSGGRKRGAALASPAMDLEETEGEPDVCMHVPLESGPSQALTVVEVESSSEEAPEPCDQPTAEPAPQGEAVVPVDSPPNSPTLQVASGAAPTSPAESSSGSESSLESSTRLAPAVSPGPARPPDPPAPSPPSSSSVSASYSPSPISIDPNEL